MKRRTIGKDTLVLSVALMLVMGFLSLTEVPHTEKARAMGLFLPSPDMWGLTREVSWGINAFLLTAIGIASIFLNRHYNFIKTSVPVGATVFFITAGSNILVTGTLGASTLLLLAHFICFSFLFDTYRKPNATQEFFIVATIIALGAMVQYSFLIMIPVFIAAGFILQAMRIREILAFGMGLIAPFWVGLGLGLLTPDQFNLPVLTNLFSYTAIQERTAVILTNMGFTLLVALLMGLNNEMRLYAGNSRVLALNNIISVSGLAAVAGIIIDYNNMDAYLATLYFACSYQTANMFALRNIKHGIFFITVTTLIYISLFATSILI